MIVKTMKLMRENENIRKYKWEHSVLKDIEDIRK